MNVTRLQTVLGGLLVLQVLLILVFRSPWSVASRPEAPELMFPALQELTTGRIVLGEPGGEEGELTLVRDGEGWSVEEADGFPADRTKVQDLLDNLGELRVRRPVVSSARYHEAFEVGDDDHAARVRIWGDEDDEPAADLILGSSSNYRTIHARRAGENEVWEVSGIASWDVRPEPGSWIDKELIDAPQAAVRRVVVDNAQGRFELQRSDDGGWRVVEPAEAAGTSLDAGKVDELIRSAASLRLADAAGRVDPDAQGLASPAARVVLEWTAAAAGDESAGDDGEGEVDDVDQVDEGAPEPAGTQQRAELLIGGSVPEESQRYVTREGFGYAGTIWESTLQALLEADLSGLQAQAESETEIDPAGEEAGTGEAAAAAGAG